MCTLTWSIQNDGSYCVLFNRDELLSRLPGSAPAYAESESGVGYLSPIDGDAGGTWIAANELGLTFCLLNNYLIGERPEIEYRSRGEVIRRLVACREVTEVKKALRAIELKRYKGFDLVVFSPNPIEFRWNGETLEETCPLMPLTSSPFLRHRDACIPTSRYMPLRGSDGPNETLSSAP